MDMKKAISEQEGASAEDLAAKKQAAGLKNQSLLNQQSPHALRNPFRLAVHAKKRFAKVYGLCNQLVKVAEKCLDGFAQYEVKAYADSMQAAYLLEVGKWSEALDALVRAKAVY